MRGMLKAWGAFVLAAVSVLVVLLWATWAGAQPVTNPTQVLFTPSADHAIVTSYEFGYFAVGAPSPVQTASVAKAALTPTGTDVLFPFPRLLFGTWEHKLRACAPVAPPGTGLVCSAWVPADKQGIVSPFGPSGVRLGSS